MSFFQSSVRMIKPILSVNSGNVFFAINPNESFEVNETAAPAIESVHDQTDQFSLEFGFGL